MEAVAHTLAYDGTVVAGLKLFAAPMAAVTVPTLVTSSAVRPRVDLQEID